MIKEAIVQHLKSNFHFELTNDQSNALTVIASFILEKNPESVLIIRGYAGTGKTTLITGLVKTLENMKFKTVLLAPTGRAAKILSGFTKKPAFTIHKKIYRQKSAKDGFGEFSIDRNLYTNTFFIIDESSMLTNQKIDASVFGSGCLLDDLFTYILNGINCRLILIGDTAQLPPVGFLSSPALEKEILTKYSSKIFETELKDVVRQEEDSGILINATRLRHHIEKDDISLPVLSVKNSPDIIVLNGTNLIETINDCYHKYGINQTIIITRSNKRANLYNKGIRNTVLWREEEIATGDFLMIVKNNYFWGKDKINYSGFIANGDIAEVIKIHKYESIYEFRFADVTLRFVDYDNMEIRTKILLDTLTVDAPSLTPDDNKRLFYNILNDFLDIKGKQKQYDHVKENDFFNALQVKFSYAVTCHKAQGGQWKAVFIDQGYLTHEMITLDYLRWLYTSFTRATEKLYLVNFSDNIFTFE